MATVFHARLHGRFMEIQSNLRRKKLHRTNQDSNFLGGSFSNIDYVRALIQFRRKRKLHYLKNDFSSRTDPSIFTSIAKVLLDRSNETSWVFPAYRSKRHFPLQSTFSRRSHSSSNSNSSYCHRSDDWSDLEKRKVSLAQITILQIT